MNYVFLSGEEGRGGERMGGVAVFGLFGLFCPGVLRDFDRARLIIYSVMISINGAGSLHFKVLGIRRFCEGMAGSREKERSGRGHRVAMYPSRGVGSREWNSRPRKIMKT